MAEYAVVCCTLAAWRATVHRQPTSPDTSFGRNCVLTNSCCVGYSCMSTTPIKDLKQTVTDQFGQSVCILKRTAAFEAVETTADCPDRITIHMWKDSTEFTILVDSQTNTRQ